MKILKITAVLIAGLLAVSAHAQSGKWDETPAGLPYYQYQGPLPYDAEESDPAFLLGNYRLSLKTHLSGIYEIMSGVNTLLHIIMKSYRRNAQKNETAYK